MSIEKIKKNRDFKTVYNKGKSYANKYLVLYLNANNLGKNRIGVSISKKVGNSVVRHRLARLIKESYRLNQTRLCKDFDFVIIARKDAKGKSYKEIESALIHLAKMHHILKKEEKKDENE